METYILAAFVALALSTSAVDVSHRVISGNLAAAGDHPWQLSLRAPTIHSCGAVIIAMDKGITAAHCVGSSGYTIRAGTTQRSYCSGNCQDRDVSSTTRHPSYSAEGTTYTNDIATIRWDEPLVENTEVAAIELATDDADTESGCVISGWGFTEEGNPTLPEDLHWGDTEVAPQMDCVVYWGPELISDGNICIMTNYNGACYGDDGGPLACNGTGTWKVGGVSSWQAPDCTVSAPSVYTRISYYVDWINSN